MQILLDSGLLLKEVVAPMEPMVKGHCITATLLVSERDWEKVLPIFSVTVDYCPCAPPRQDCFSLMNFLDICSFGGWGDENVYVRVARQTFLESSCLA